MFLSTTNVRLIYKGLENRNKKFLSNDHFLDTELLASTETHETERVDSSDQLPNLFFDNLPELECLVDIMYPVMQMSLDVSFNWNHLVFLDPKEIQLLNLDYSIIKPPSQFVIFS
jgi:hypothetical protein